MFRRERVVERDVLVVVFDGVKAERGSSRLIRSQGTNCVSISDRRVACTNLVSVIDVAFSRQESDPERQKVLQAVHRRS